MKWSWKIASVAHIGIYVHFTFPILLLWVGISRYLRRHQWQDAVIGIGFVALLFAIVVMHELGHALAARHFRIHTRDITLLPIGGVAHLERIPPESKQELVIALAGPAVNGILALVLFGVIFVGGKIFATAMLNSVAGSWLLNLLQINIALALFNLLPAFPMDGGRALRALLAMRLPYVRATDIAAQIGQGMAWVFGFIGILTNPLLVLIALFIWIGAGHEARVVETTAIISGVPVRRVMVTEFGTLAPGDTLARAVEHVLAGYQHDFPVVESGKLVGVLTHSDLLMGLASHERTSLVNEVMQHKLHTVEPTDKVETILGRLGEEDCRTMPVVHDGKLVGILTAENIGEYLMIQAVLRDFSPTSPVRTAGITEKLLLL
jgi:Zn-dependent protease